MSANQVLWPGKLGRVPVHQACISKANLGRKLGVPGIRKDRRRKARFGAQPCFASCPAAHLHIEFWRSTADVQKDVRPRFFAAVTIAACGPSRLAAWGRSRLGFYAHYEGSTGHTGRDYSSSSENFFKDGSTCPISHAPNKSVKFRPVPTSAITAFTRTLTSFRLFWCQLLPDTHEPGNNVIIAPGQEERTTKDESSIYVRDSDRPSVVLACARSGGVVAAR